MGLNIGQRKLSTGDTVLGASLIVGLISTFLPWFSASYNCAGNAFCNGLSTSSSVNGFSSWGWLYFLLILAIGAFFVIRTFVAQMQMPALPAADWMLYLIGGAVALVAGLLYYTAVPHGADVLGLSYGVSFGWIIALIAGLGLVAGAYLKRTDPQPAVAPRSSLPPGGGYGAPTQYAPPQPGYGPPQQPAPPQAPPVPPPGPPQAPPPQQ